MTQLVDLASGAVTELPLAGSGFAWQPVASEIVIPDGNTGIPQTPNAFIEIAPIMAITCTTSSEGFWISGGGGMNMPEGCNWSNGATFTVSGPNGESYGGCTIDGFACNGEIQLPVDVEVTVTLDETTIPEGYAVVEGNPKRFTLPASKVGSDSEQWLFVSMPAEAAEQPAIWRWVVARAWQQLDRVYGNRWQSLADATRWQRPDAGDVRGFARCLVWVAVLVARRVDAGVLQRVERHHQVYLLRDGTVSAVPGVYGCNAAAFLPGDQQIAMTCGRDGDANASQQALQADPSLGLISIANLDGSDWRVQVTYNQTDSNIWPTLGIGPGASTVGSVSIAPDGTIYFAYSTQMSSGMAFVPPDSSTVERMESSMESGSAGGVFIDAAGAFLVAACRGCYIHSHEEPQFSIGWMDRDGTITATLLTLDPTLRLGDPTISPDGGTLVYPIADGDYPWYGPIQSRDLASGTETTIAQGWGPVWQPNPGVAMQVPASAEGAAVTSEPTEQSQPPTVATMPAIDVTQATANYSPEFGTASESRRIRTENGRSASSSPAVVWVRSWERRSIPSNRAVAI